MIRRPLLIALSATALYAAVLVTTASAEMRQLRLTLVTGQQLTVTVDVPPGTPVDQIQIPGLPSPIKSVEDLGPVSTPTPPSVPSVTATPTPPSTATPTAPSTATPTAPSTATPTAPSTATPTAPSTATPGAAVPSPTATGTPEGNTSHDDSNGDKSGKAGGHRHGPSSHSNAIDGAGANVESLTGKVKQAVGDAAKGAGPTGGSGGAPTPADPTFTQAPLGAAKIGVPNFFIEKFRIPPFLLPIYQAAGTEYGVRWELLAAINEIETDYGRNLTPSTAGAVGWMQFLPSTWKRYGVDANQDRLKDPYNPVDAIFSAARYLRAAGADKDIRGAVFSYNHADWYVDSVLLRAQLIGGLPSNLVGSLTGLTDGRFPVRAKATYADDLSKQELRRKRRGNRALVIQSTSHRRGINVFARAGAPVVAVNDARVVRIGRSPRLGRFVQIQDVYGNTYTYARLAKVAKRYAAPKPRRTTPQQITREMRLRKRDAKPTAPASDTTRPATIAPERSLARKAAPVPRRMARPNRAAVTKERLFAHPARSQAADAGGAQQEFQRTGRIDGTTAVPADLARVFGLSAKEIVVKKLRPGARVPAGTILGRIGHTFSIKAPHLLFEIRPAGRGAPRIDPKPILDGWKLLESTAIYRAKGRNPFYGPDAATPSIGQILLMSKETLGQRVLADPNIDVYQCGRRDIRAGEVDRRVLAALEFLVASGFKPTVTALKCGHSFYTSSGNVSEHSSGNAVDIAKVNGIPILGHQGPGSITEMVIQRLLTLQGTMQPHQIISLMTFQGARNTLALTDHADHIHIGFQPLYGTNSKLAKQVNAILKPKQWIRLVDRLGQIDNPRVRLTPSKFALKTTERGSPANRGD